jgi:gliding motility-associated-like protein
MLNRFFLYKKSIYLLLTIFITNINLLFACDPTPSLIPTNVIDNGDGTYYMDISACIGSASSLDGFDLYFNNDINIIGTTVTEVVAPLTGNVATVSVSNGTWLATYSGGGYFEDNYPTDCIDFGIIVDNNPEGATICSVGLNEDCLGWTQTDVFITCGVVPGPCLPNYFITDNGTIDSDLIPAGQNCNFAPFNDEIIELIVTCDGNFNFSLTQDQSTFFSGESWLTIAAGCCSGVVEQTNSFFDPTITIDTYLTEGTYYIIADIFTDSFTPGDYILNVTSDVNSTIPQSNAGENQELCENTTTLNANTLQDDEIGTWVVISGNAVFDDINNPNTVVSGLNTGDNTLEWNVESECSEEIASSQIIINVAQPPYSNAGENQELCENFTTLDANSPQEDEIGTWIVISGNAVFNNINDPNAIVSGLNIGENIFQWTISSLLCGEYTDQVSMIYIDNIPYSNAGENQELCEDFTTLNANSIQNTETGIWTIISGNGNFITPNNPNTQVTNLSLGENIFEWTVEDACNSVSSQVAITFQNTTNTIQSISNYNGFNISCPQTSDGFIEITTTGGYPPYSFNWSGPNSFSSSAQNIYNLEAGMYDCVVTDQLSCESTISIQLTPPYPLEIDFIGVEDMNCFDNPYIDFDITGGTGELEGVINTSWGEVITFIADNSNEWYFQYDNFTQWDGEINISIIDSNGCTLNSDDITVQTWDDPVGNFDVSTNNTSISELIDFFDLSNSEAEIINWTWDFGDGTISNLQNPTHFYQGNDQYTVCLTIEDANGCISEKCSIINIFNNTHAYIPNIFTINDDELNEVFEPIIYGLDTDTYNLLIYDRWGKLLFSTTDHQKGWDGKYNGQIVTQDIYSYKIKYNTISGEEKTHTGKITLMK